MITDAVILAAGRGARLDRPGTPKPLVDVDGESLIGRLMVQLEAAGVARIAVIGLAVAGPSATTALTVLLFTSLAIAITINVLADPLAGVLDRKDLLLAGAP